MSVALPKPRAADRLVERAKRRDARRSATTTNPNELAFPRPQVWHCKGYREWATKRFDCAIKGRNGHRCGPTVDRKLRKEFAHFEPEGKGLKCSDNRGIVLCADAHQQLQHRMGWQTFQKRYGIDREAIARAIFDASHWRGQVEVSW